MRNPYDQRIKVAVIYQVDDGPVQHLSGWADDLEFEMKCDEFEDEYFRPYTRTPSGRPRHKLTVDFGYHEVTWGRRDFEDIPDEPGETEARRELPLGHPPLPPGPIALPGGGS